MTRLTHNTLKLDLFLAASPTMYACITTNHERAGGGWGGGYPPSVLYTLGTATACYMSKFLKQWLQSVCQASCDIKDCHAFLIL